MYVYGNFESNWHYRHLFSKYYLNLERQNNVHFCELSIHVATVSLARQLVGQRPLRSETQLLTQPWTRVGSGVWSDRHNRNKPTTSTANCDATNFEGTNLNFGEIDSKFIYNIKDIYQNIIQSPNVVLDSIISTIFDIDNDINKHNKEMANDCELD